MKLSCVNCPIKWNSSDFKCKLTVGNALQLLAQYTVISDFVVENLCLDCNYIDFYKGFQDWRKVFGN